MIHVSVLNCTFYYNLVVKPNILIKRTSVKISFWNCRTEGYDTNRNLVQPPYKSTQIPESAQIPESGKEIWKSEILFEI